MRYPKEKVPFQTRTVGNLSKISMTTYVGVDNKKTMIVLLAFSGVLHQQMCILANHLAGFFGSRETKLSIPSKMKFQVPFLTCCHIMSVSLKIFL